MQTKRHSGKRRPAKPYAGASRKRKPAPRRKKDKALDPNLFIRQATDAPEVKETPGIYFSDMDLHKKLQSNIDRKGYKHPTPIQEACFAPISEGRDTIGIASTGTGKTAAILIPIINQLLTTGQTFSTLVVVPTRELALQVETELFNLTKGTQFTSTSLIGGTSIHKNLSKLRRRNQFIIGTPGRIMDMAQRGALKLDRISTLVLDEFDRMLDMGFVDDIRKITAGMTNRSQTLLFSATKDKTQQGIIDSLLTDPFEVSVNPTSSTSEQVEQDVVRVPQGGDKFEVLLKMLSSEEYQKVILFIETKRLVDRMSKRLNQSGIRSELIHGDKSQNFRNNALRKFKHGNVKVLVATDVAARGIDVSDVTHVINYQAPKTYDSYIHRIGRTGRAGKRGKALTFVDQ